MHAKSLVLVLLLAGGAVALAAQSASQPTPSPQPQPRVQPRAPRAGVMAEEGFVAPRQRMQQALGLDEKQVASLEKLMSDRRKDAIRQGAEERIARIELEELMRAETLDQKAIEAKIDQIAQLYAAPMRARVEHHLAVQKILTPEQFKQWQAMRPAFGGRAMGSRAFRGDGPRRWHDGGGPRGPRPMGPPPPEAGRPPAGPEGEPGR